MQIGAVLSQSEVGADVGALRAYAQAVQELGYDFLVAADHVVGSDPAAHPDLERVYPIDSFLHEPLTLVRLPRRRRAPARLADQRRSSCPSARPCWPPSRPPRSTC